MSVNQLLALPRRETDDAERAAQSRLLSKHKAQDKQLLIASRAFAVEKRVVSWWHLLSTLAALLVSGAAAALSDMFLVRCLGCLVTGLVIVRLFILYHDFQHNAIFKDSFVAKLILNTYGYLMLTPPSVWKRSHDHHHNNNSKLFGASIGSFPIMTLEKYRKATKSERFEYHIARNPMIIVFGYFFVFLYGMCIRPLIVDSKRHWDASVAIVVHFGCIIACLSLGGWMTALLLFVLPSLIACGTGAYLFYVQHNFPDAKISDNDEWTYTGAALQSSSFMKMGPVMHWLTGNIGYHHVHHLNSKIPFYRLPEAMNALKPLQSPSCTSWKIKDIAGCLRLKLWDVNRKRFVTFGAVKRRSSDEV